MRRERLLGLVMGGGRMMGGVPSFNEIFIDMEIEL